MYISRNEEGMIVATSDRPVSINGNQVDIQSSEAIQVGKKSKSVKPKSEMKVALVCNWNLPCGISTYSKFLADALREKVKELKIFSEVGEPLTPDDSSVERCWERGKPLRSLANRLKDYNPDYCIIQHEYGVFPNACYFLSFLQHIDQLPYVVTLHSTYEHLDKTICTAPIRCAIVHSEQAKATIARIGHRMPCHVVPHGCFNYTDVSELWNIFNNPYTIVQFGFGFRYKGVDRALEAVGLLKKTDQKFKEIFYCYLCSENPHNVALHDQYVRSLVEKAEELNISDNVAIVRGFQDEKIINNYLRTAKLAIFPYKIDPDNKVYGASGAIRIALANKVPTIASESHLFDDLEGVIPRPNSSELLAKEIDEIFSNGKYRQGILSKMAAHTAKFSWDHTANCYLDIVPTLER